jgi:hypothetical protein
MKYIKKYEYSTDMSYLDNIDEFILIGSRNDKYSGHIIKNLGDQFRKLYDVMADGKLRTVVNFYFTLSEETFNELNIYQSNNIDDILNKISLFISSKKYNL